MSNPSQNLPDLLVGHGMRPKSYSPGSVQKIICPQCTGGKTREISMTLTIDQDGGGAKWLCHRGTCGFNGGERIASYDHRAPSWHQPEPKPTSPPAHPAADQGKPLTMYQFFEKRGISAETVDIFGIYVTRCWFPGDEGEQSAIVFPYVFEKSVVNRKYRSPGKMFIQEKNPLPTLFNVDAIEAPDLVIWVEGEADCMAVHEAGYPQVVTLANGAPAKLRAEDDPRRQDDKRFTALSTHAEMLGKVGKFILAGDMDAPGAVLREELARRLGRHRCWMVTWPEGCKDACDTLKAHGPAGVADAIEAATAYPIAGLQQIKTGTLMALRHQRPPSVLTTGTRSTDRMMACPTEGRLIVVTGWPGSGKTSWVRFVMVHTAIEHHRKWAVFSPEMQPWETFAAECAEVYLGKPFWPKGSVAGMTDAEVADAEMWLKDRMTMIVSDAEDESPTLDWILERAGVAVLRDGVTDLCIDPWNEIAHERGGANETDYTGRALQRLKAFGLRHGCNIWLIVHPAKPPAVKPGEKRGIPGPYDIAGSAHYFNKADMGVTVHSTAPGSAEIHLWKTRHRRWGVRSAIGKLDFDDVNGRYNTPADQLAPPKNAPKAFTAPLPFRETDDDR
jgi:twinkle protein